MLRALVVFSILIPGMFWAMTSRFRALLLYLWFAFFRPQEWVWFSIKSYRFSLILGLILLVPALLTGVLPNMTHPLSIGALLFLATGFLAQTNAVDQTLGWYWLDIHSTMTIICLMTITIVRTPRQLMQVIAVAAGCMGFFAAKAGFVSLVSGGVQFGEGLEGAFTDNNSYAIGTVMTIPFLVALAQNADLTFGQFVPAWAIRWIRVGLWASLPLCVYTIVSTFSRSGFLAFLAAVLTYTIIHPRRFRLLLTLGLLSTLLFVVPLPQGYVDRLATIQKLQEDVEPGEGDVTEGRFYFWSVAVQMAEDHPLGIGMRNFSVRYEQYNTLGGTFGRRRDVHSSHFQVLAEQGFLGAIVWILMLGYSLVVSLRVKRRSRTPGLSAVDAKFMQTMSLAIMVSMIGFIVGGSTVSLALNDLTWLTFALVAALDRMSAEKCGEAARTNQAPAVGPSGLRRAPVTQVRTWATR